MAVLDVQLHRGSLSIGRSTSYERTPRGLLGAVLGIAVGLRAKAWRSGECFVGRVRRPSMARLLPLIDEARTSWSGTELLGPRWPQVVELVDVASGEELRSEYFADDAFVVVLEGRGALRVGDDAHVLEPGVVAALAPGLALSLAAAEPPLRLLVCRLHASPAVRVSSA